MRSRQSRRDIRTDNFKRQAQALTILTIGTVILGAALFQADITLPDLSATDQLANRFSISFMLVAVAAYIGLSFGTMDILAQTTPITGNDINSKMMNHLLLEAITAILSFLAGTLSTPS